MKTFIKIAKFIWDFIVYFGTLCGMAVSAAISICAIWGYIDGGSEAIAERVIDIWDSLRGKKN